MRALFPIFTVCLLLNANQVFAGFIGAGSIINSSVTFDKQDDGLRLDWGSNINKHIDLEWSHIDFGSSRYDDPTYVAADITDTDDTNDTPNFENIGFGDVSRSEGSYKGISRLDIQALSAGLKFKKDATNWLQFYARASFLAWQADTTNIEIYGPRDGRDAEGELLAGGVDPLTASNLNPCGHLESCRVADIKGKTHWAVDFWYGYGLLIKPYDWLAFRAEYSIVTLNAVDFPRAKLDGFTTSVEMHF